MASSSVSLGQLPANLDSCQPNLMPFKIAHTGPAAISTFMKVKTVEPEVEASNGTQESDKENVTTEPPSGPTDSEASQAMKTESSPADANPAANPAAVSTDDSERFISAFRGRTIQGLTVNLPQGYQGLVLKGPSSTQPKASTSKVQSKALADSEDAPKASTSRPRGRLTRSAKSTKAIDVDQPAKIIAIEDNSEMDIDNSGPSTVNDNASTRTLLPVAQFSSILLWTPDNPVVEIRDEYFRSMQEWTAIAAEVHQSEVL